MSCTNLIPGAYDISSHFILPGLIKKTEKEMPGKYTVVTDLWNKAGHIS